MPSTVDEVITAPAEVSRSAQPRRSICRETNSTANTTSAISDRAPQNNNADTGWLKTNGQLASSNVAGNVNAPGSATSAAAAIDPANAERNHQQTAPQTAMSSMQPRIQPS